MDSKQLKDFFVIVPAYNEEKNIREVLQKIVLYTNNIIVVDDGSIDDTYEIAKKVDSNIIVLKHKINLGKGAALKTGCEAALIRGANILALIDSDGQHLPEDMMKLVEKLIEKKLDIVFGERTFNDDMPFMMKMGNQLLTFTIKLFSKINLSDTQCGLRVLTSDAYKKIKWQEQNYSVETEMIINAGKYDMKYESVGIKTIYKDKYKGTTIIDGIIILINLLKWKIL
ncbi:MAG: glycosyltransferase family 2 protein [Parcubacteria group bacterium]